MKHLSSENNTKYRIAYQKNIEGIQQSDKTLLAYYISKANSDVAYNIGSLLIMHAPWCIIMKLVLPEYSFPARAVVIMIESEFKYNSVYNIITNTDLQ